MVTMDMARKPNKHFYARLVITATTLATVLPLTAGEWTFNPNLTLDETYSDNVELKTTDKKESYVNQTRFGLDIAFNSRLAEFNFSGKNTLASYSHDHNSDDNFITLNSDARYNLWTSGPALIAKVNIANQSRNSANNGFADIISGDTVETRNYQYGIEYNLNNSVYIFNSSFLYQILEADDNIGESQGYTASIRAHNGTSARSSLWQLIGTYTERKNNDLSGDMYNIEALAGMINVYGINPFIRFYDENATGSISGNRNTSSSSIGPGLRWIATSHFYIDLSYNYSDDKTKSSNYIATAINWQPSTRTTLNVSYNKRFFGNSYHLEFKHKIRRLSNNISYTETVSAFDRNTFKQVDLGSFWCPINAPISDDISACFVSSNSNINFDDFQLINISNQELVAGNEFSLNKILTWKSDFKLARTSFSLTLNSNNRESLTTNRVEKRENASLVMIRKISGKSDLNVSLTYRHQQFDKNNINDSAQEDYYRIYSTSYSRKLASSLSSNITFQYVDRNSSVSTRTYNETRAIINITKEF